MAMPCPKMPQNLPVTEPLSTYGPFCSTEYWRTLTSTAYSECPDHAGGIPMVTLRHTIMALLTLVRAGADKVLCQGVVRAGGEMEDSALTLIAPPQVTGPPPPALYARICPHPYIPVALSIHIYSLFNAIAIRQPPLTPNWFCIRLSLSHTTPTNTPANTPTNISPPHSPAHPPIHASAIRGTLRPRHPLTVRLRVLPQLCQHLHQQPSLRAPPPADLPPHRIAARSTHERPQ